MEFNLKAAGEASQDALVKGIIETVLKDSPVLQMLPFIPIEGNTLTYWQERAVAGLAAWRHPGETWTDVTDFTKYAEWAASTAYVLGDLVRPTTWAGFIYECTTAGTSGVSEPSWPKTPGQTVIDNTAVWTCRAATAPLTTEKSASLKILGGDIDFDNYARRLRPRPEGYDAALVDMKSKAMRYEFEDCFLNGDRAVHADKFDGLYKLLHSTTQEIYADGAGSAGASLTLTLLEELIDKVKGGPPDLLLMSARSRRDLNKLVRASGAILETRPGMFGEYLQVYNGIPIGVSDWVKDDYLVGSDLNCSAIFAFQMSESAVSGISTPEMIEVERLGKLETKDAERIRAKWYVSTALFSLPRAAVLAGVKPVA